MIRPQLKFILHSLTKDVFEQSPKTTLSLGHLQQVAHVTCHILGIRQKVISA